MRQIILFLRRRFHILEKSYLLVSSDSPYNLFSKGCFKELEAYCTSYPDDIDAELLLIYASVLQGDVQKITRQLNKINRDDQDPKIKANHLAIINILKTSLSLLEGKSSKALETFDLINRNQTELGDPWTAEYTYLQSQFFVNDGDLQSADTVLSETKTGISRNETYEIAYLDLHHSFILRHLRKLSDAEQAILNAISIFTKLNNSSLLALAYSKYGTIIRGQRNYEEAKQYYEKAILLGQSTHSIFALQDAHHSLGVLYQIIGELDLSMEHLGRALTIREKLGVVPLIGQSNMVLGMLSQNLGHYEEAMAYFQGSLDAYRNIGNKPLIAAVLSNIGIVQENLGNYPTAVDYLLEALSIREELGIPVEIMMSLDAIGDLYIQMGDLAKAEEYLLRYQSLPDVPEDVLLTGAIKFQLGIVALRRGEVTKCIDMFLQSYEIFDKNQKKLRKIECLLHLGSVYYLHANYSRSIEYLETSKIILEEINNPIYQSYTNFYLLLDYIALSDQESIISVLNQQSDLTLTSEIDTVHHIRKIMNLFAMKNGFMEYNRDQIHEGFRQLLDEKKLEFSLLIFAVFNYLELIVEALEETGAISLVNEIQYWTEYLREKAIQSRSYNLLLELTLIHAKLSILKGDIKSGIRALDGIQQLIEDNGLSYLIPQYTNAKENLEIELKNWNQLHMVDNNSFHRNLEPEIKSYVRNAWKYYLSHS